MASQNQMIGVLPGSPPASSLVTVRLLSVISRFIDKYPWIAFSAVSLVLGYGCLSGMASRHLDNDEIFTFYIADAPTLSHLFQFTHTVDLHPPLSYVLVRFSFKIFGASSWSCRLPFFIAFLVFSAILFSFASHLLSPLYGLMTTLALWSSSYSFLATEARSYSLVLCFTATMLVHWYAIIETDDRSDRKWSFAMLIAGGFGLLLSHVLGALAYGSFLAAEAIRFWIRRRPDWQVWAALLIPLPAVLTYLPLIRNRSEILFSPWAQASPRRLAICYWEHLRYFATPLTVILVIALLLPLISKRPDGTLGSNLPAADLSLRWLLLFLFLVPMEITILFVRTHTAFYERYGVVALIPCALVPFLFLGYRIHCDRLAGVCMLILLAILHFVNTSGRAWMIEQLSGMAPSKVAAKLVYIAAPPPIMPPKLSGSRVPAYLENDLLAAPPVSQLDGVAAELPLVAGTGPTFIELDRYQDAALAQRLYLLTNHEAASTITHNTVSDHYELVKAAFPIRGQVEAYCTFLRKHNHFLVLGGYNYPDTWLLRKLEMDGATLSIIGTFEDPVIEEHQIYRVTMGKRPCEMQP